MTRGSQLRVQIAEFVLALRSNDPQLKLRVESSMEAFLVDEGDADVAIEVCWADRDFVEPAGAGEFNSRGVWKASTAGDRIIFSFASPEVGSSPYRIAYFNSDFTSGTIFLHRSYYPAGDPVNPLEYPLGELIINVLLARGAGAEVHACGVRDADGNGLLFVGHSGDGKTTLARLWDRRERTTILSDDRIVLRKARDGFWMYGTPWHGEAEFSSPERAPLSRIFFLRHSRENQLGVVGRAEAVARLFSCSFPPLYRPGAVESGLDVFSELVNVVPHHELGFTPHETVIDFVRRNAQP